LATPADGQLRFAIRLPAILHGPGAADFLAAIRREFNLADVVSISVDDQAYEGDETVLFLSFIRDVPIEAKELGEASGVVVPLGGNLILRFSSKGELVSYELEEIGPEAIESQTNGILALMQRNQVYVAKPWESVSIPKLISAGKIFVLQVDEKGTKRLVRIVMPG